MKKILFIFSILFIPALVFAANPSASETVDKLNSLLRGELSAIETYQQALQKVKNEPGEDMLRTYMSNHQKASDKLRSEIAKLGGTPSTDSGAWGAWAKTVEGSAKIFGNTAALTALKKGEEHGLEEYQEALNDKEILPDTKTLIRDNFVENQQTHINGLQGFIDKKA